MKPELNNPFYCQPVFSKDDLDRCMIRKRDLLWLWMLPTYVQLNEGYAFHYKRWQGKIYVVKFESNPSQVR